MARLQLFIKKHERHLSSGALIVGFIVDLLTLVRVDIVFDAIVFLVHITIITLTIVLIALYDGKRYIGKYWLKIRQYAPLFLQFSLGAFFSGLTVFYLRSTSFTTTLFFLLILIGLLIGNEFFRNRYQQTTFQFSVFFIGLASFFVLYVPVVVHTTGAVVFVAATVLAVLYIFILFLLIRRLVPQYVRNASWSIATVIGLLFLSLQVLYFSNSIPPVPLVMKEGTVYHAVHRTGTTYRAIAEEQPWYSSLLRKRIHVVPGESLSFYSAVFAPTALTTSVTHRWEKWNPNTRRWENTEDITFPITGGRAAGYRGYSEKSSLVPGRWRVSVLTQRGQVIGRTYFTIVEVQHAPKTKEIVL